MTMTRTLRVLLCAAAAVAAWTGPAAAADPFPSKPIRIVVPTPAGGNLDLVIRAMSEQLSTNIGQPVLVENRSGGSSAIGTKFVAQSPADGYTLLAIGNTFMSAPAVVANIGYDPLKDFVGVSLIGRIANVLVVPANSPSKTLHDLIERAKARPGAISYGSAGAGSVGNFAAERFAREIGAKLLHVPYKGGGPALIDVVGGRLEMMFDQISTSTSFLRSGNLRSLGVATLKRSPNLPDIPTLDEQGLTGFEDYAINAVVAPAGIPREILQRLHAEIVKALNSPKLRDNFALQGIELLPSASLDEFDRFVKREVSRYAALARDANIKSE